MSETIDKDTEAKSIAEIPDPTLYTWQSHPAKARPLVTVAVVAFLLLLVALVYIMTLSPMFTVVGALILWGSLSQYFLKTEFSLTERKVRVKYLVNKIEKEWSQYRSYYEDKNGVLLSPFVRPSRLENFRGIYIRFNANRDDVMNIVKSKIRKIEDPV